MTEAALGDAESTLILEQLNDAAPGAALLSCSRIRVESTSSSAASLIG